MSLRRLLSGLAAAAVIAGGAVGASAAPPAGVEAEIVLSADRAVWRPQGGALKGVLTLRDVSSRMAVLSGAPRQEVAIVPAGFLRETWSQLFPRSTAKATRGRRITNGVIAIGSGRERRLVPVRLELVGGYADGSRFAFRIRPLRATAHPTDRLGLQKRTYEDVTVLVDPLITNAIKSLWKSLLEYFSGESLGVPRNPTYPGEDGKTVFDPAGGDSSAGGQDYAGPLAAFGDQGEWVQAQQSNWDLAGAGYASDIGTAQAGAAGATFVDFSAASYEGLAVFNHNFTGSVEFSPRGSSMQVTNSALYKVQAAEMTISSAEFGGVNMRGLDVGTVTISNAVFQTVDMTGLSFGAAGFERGSVRGVAFVDVTANRTADNPDGSDDGATARMPGASFAFVGTDFTAVVFENASLRGGAIAGSTFQASSFQSVDLSGSVIEGGSDTSPGGQFEPTFDGSIFQDVSFDGAELESVSFAGVDFSAGKVSFDGATLTNVDFTGATGLQLIDWSTVTIEGNVYGLEEVSSLLDLREHPEYLRTITFDGQVPEIDPDSGFDIEPATGYLIDTGTGVRLDRDSIGALIPVDPETGEPLTDQYGDPLLWTPDRGVTTTDGTPVEIDYATGEVAGE